MYTARLVRAFPYFSTLDMSYTVSARASPFQLGHMNNISVLFQLASDLVQFASVCFSTTGALKLNH
ncbi:DNA-directed RNA polymerase subunit beta [Dorcoceras hygrometricum]|uniref:DNA-directed RNA polymerase subunit beta n=1 Tax=Dorcoceras hygrometricum TaxID=472368 RepID=A0A2Z7AUC1_9LAMI|nr:DNA-directed RNA polymerase subunit beta [Dorcoceras hygrometricum]